MGEAGPLMGERAGGKLDAGLLGKIVPVSPDYRTGLRSLNRIGRRVGGLLVGGCCVTQRFPSTVDRSPNLANPHTRPSPENLSAADSPSHPEDWTFQEIGELLDVSRNVIE